MSAPLGEPKIPGESALQRLTDMDKGLKSRLQNRMCDIPPFVQKKRSSSLEVLRVSLKGYEVAGLGQRKRGTGFPSGECVTFLPRAFCPFLSILIHTCMPYLIYS
jgi:hypothetical protein